MPFITTANPHVNQHVWHLQTWLMRSDELAPVFSSLAAQLHICLQASSAGSRPAEPSPPGRDQSAVLSQAGGCVQAWLPGTREGQQRAPAALHTPRGPRELCCGGCSGPAHHRAQQRAAEPSAGSAAGEREACFGTCAAVCAGEPPPAAAAAAQVPVRAAEASLAGASWCTGCAQPLSGPCSSLKPTALSVLARAAGPYGRPAAPCYPVPCVLLERAASYVMPHVGPRVVTASSVEMPPKSAAAAIPEGPCTELGCSPATGSSSR